MGEQWSKYKQTKHPQINTNTWTKNLGLIAIVLPAAWLEAAAAWLGAAAAWLFVAVVRAEEVVPLVAAVLAAGAARLW